VTGTPPAYEDARTRPYRTIAATGLRHNGVAMIGFLLLLFPFVLLGFMLLMGRVEEPLTRVAEERDIEQFLDDASPDELDTFVREGTDSALSRFRHRLGLGRLRRSATSEPNP
jgi:hypothetical protein